MNIDSSDNFKLKGGLNNIIQGLCFALALLFTFSACKQQTNGTGPKYSDTLTTTTIPVYHLAVHPLHNPVKLMSVYQPLIDYLNGKIKEVQFFLETSRDYSNFEQKYKDGEPELILPNPWQTLQAIKAGYHVVAGVGEPEDFKGIFIVRKDGGINNPADLKGKAVSYPSPTALAACIMPQYFLHNNGIDVNHDIENRYVGSQESSIMNVYVKNTVAGCTWPPPWRFFQKNNPAEAAELKVIWETESLINNSFMIRNDIPDNISEMIQKYLVTLHETEEGKKILAGMETARIIPATNKDYGLVQAYIERFEKKVCKVEMK